MSLNPLNELKRRLEDDKTTLPKRLCLARNVVQSHHFPTAAKERIVAEWLQSIAERNSLKNSELNYVLDWLLIVDDLTTELKSKLIQVVLLYLRRNRLQTADVRCIIIFIENSKISKQLSTQIDNYLTITITLLQYLCNTPNSTQLSQRILNNFVKYYKESKKKLDFIVKLLNGENLETIFSFLDTECRKTVIDVCQNILFPITKKSYFISFLQTLVRKNNIQELIAEKGDNIQSVIKTMNTFFEFPKNRTKEHYFSQTTSHLKFLHNFIDVFVSSYQKENQLIFAFYIMATDALKMEQSFIKPAMNMSSIIPDDNEKLKRDLLLKMLEVLLDNEIDINVRLTDTFGEKIPKVEIKKNFASFLQAVMMGQLKLEGKVDKTTLQIIRTALKLDPMLIEQKKLTILPAIMTSKKSSSNIVASYSEMLKCLLEILFKLSRGTLFLNEILPPIKTFLEAGNTEQSNVMQRVKERKESGKKYEKLLSKIITVFDVFPQECIDVYGKLTSELMFRQNKELLESLQKDLEVHCLSMLEEEFVSLSTIVLTQLLSAILSSFLNYNKMADHTVPLNIAEDFWNTYQKFEADCLNKFGLCVLKHYYNLPLVMSFLNLSHSFAKLKLLNIKYSHVPMDIAHGTDTYQLLDLSDILPCLSKKQWIELAGKLVDNEALDVLNNILLVATMANQLLAIRHGETKNEMITSTKAHLIKQISQYPTLIQCNHFCKVLFTDLDRNQSKQLATCLIKLQLENPDMNILQSEAVANNRLLLGNLVLESARNIAKCFENNESLCKVLKKSDFDIMSFAKETNITDYLNQVTIKQDSQEDIKKNVNILKELQLYYLDENYQLVAIFLLLATKKSTCNKKLKRVIDNILQSIYELSLQQPDLYQMYPVELIFSFENNTVLDLFTLKLKNGNDLLIIKSLLELAVKKVRADSHLVKTIVDKLVKKNKKKVPNMSFEDPIFQVTCIILPLIVKQKKAITASAFRSILADLQEKLHKILIESFENIDFTNTTIPEGNVGNTDDSIVENDSGMAALYAMSAYSMTLSKFCETTDSEEIKNMDCLWSTLEFFIQNAIKCIDNNNSKLVDIESSVQLLNVVLRHIKKLETNKVFEEKDKLFVQIYRCIKSRLTHEQTDKIINSSCMEDLGVTWKFVCELSSVECFGNQLVGDMTSLVTFKNPSLILSDGNTDIVSRKVFKYLWSQCLKANIVGPKCVAMSKHMHRICKNWINWVRQHYDVEDKVARGNEESSTIGRVQIVKVEHMHCELIKIDLDSLSELLLAAKKVSLDYKFVDSMFLLQQLMHILLFYTCSDWLGTSSNSFFVLFEGCVAVLNTFIIAREEVLEDRWSSYMQCYRSLVAALCMHSSSHDIGRRVKNRLAENAHNVQKLTQNIAKRKKQISRIAVYTVADICLELEKNTPIKSVRLHLENCVGLLIEASDSSYAMPFLKRALAGSPGQMTMTNLYSMYKKYHKYVGNS